MADFPTTPELSQGESPSMFDRKAEDVVYKSDSEGGYEFRRRKFTRPPRDTIKTGFKYLPHDDKVIVEDFYNARLTDTAFTYYDYINDETVTVTFDVPPEFKYVGIGDLRLWTVTITMKEI